MPTSDSTKELERDKPTEKKEKPPLSEVAARIAGVVQRVEQDKTRLAIAISNLRRTELQIKQALEDTQEAVTVASECLEQSKAQLVAELKKLDPTIVDLFRAGAEKVSA